MIMLTGIIKTLFVIKNVAALWKQFLGQPVHYPSNICTFWCVSRKVSKLHFVIRSSSCRQQATNVVPHCMYNQGCGGGGARAAALNVRNISWTLNCERNVLSSSVQ